jgi:hypothetical protein
VSLRCTNADTCPEIQAKLQVLKRMIDSHQGWDWHNPKPNGGNRHAEEIADLWGAYARCQEMARKKNCDDCDKNRKPFWQWLKEQLGPRYQYDPSQDRSVPEPGPLGNSSNPLLPFTAPRFVPLP